MGPGWSSFLFASGKFLPRYVVGVWALRVLRSASVKHVKHDNDLQARPKRPNCPFFGFLRRLLCLLLMMNLFQLYYHYYVDIHVRLTSTVPLMKNKLWYIYCTYDTYIYPACLAANARVVLSDAFLRRSFPAISSGYIRDSRKSLVGAGGSYLVPDIVTSGHTGWHLSTSSPPLLPYSP